MKKKSLEDNSKTGRYCVQHFIHFYSIMSKFSYLGVQAERNRINRQKSIFVDTAHRVRLLQGLGRK